MEKALDFFRKSNFLIYEVKVIVSKFSKFNVKMVLFKIDHKMTILTRKNSEISTLTLLYNMTISNTINTTVTNRILGIGRLGIKGAFFAPK